MRWDEWRGSFDGRTTMHIKHLAEAYGYHVDLHKFVAPDDAECFHTHPACAIRIVLWGGYWEQLEDGTLELWLPGDIGIVRPEHSHRIAALVDSRGSWSLWLRGPKRADVELRGRGWPAQAIGTHPERN